MRWTRPPPARCFLALSTPCVMRAGSLVSVCGALRLTEADRCTLTGIALRMAAAPGGNQRSPRLALHITHQIPRHNATSTGTTAPRHAPCSVVLQLLRMAFPS
jgi:hypothetical protein